MRWTTVLGVILLILVLAGVFIGLYFAYTNVGQAVKIAEDKGDIVECSADSDCPNQVCIENFCRPKS